MSECLLLFQGIGDSGQGFTNAILFILFTKSVRNSFLRLVCCKKCPVAKASRLGEATTSDEESPALLKGPGSTNHEIAPLLEGEKAVDQSPFQATMGGVSVNVDIHT